MNLKPFRYGFRAIPQNALKLNTSWSDHIKLDEGKMATPTVSLILFGEDTHICTIRMSPQEAELETDQEVLALNRSRIQAHLDEIFCAKQTVPTKIYRKS